MTDDTHRPNPARRLADTLMAATYAALSRCAAWLESDASPRWLLVVHIHWGSDAWYVTGKEGDRSFCWLLFGPAEKDGIRIWQLVVWRLYIAWGWR